MKKDLSFKLFTVIYLLSSIPLLGYSAYEIFRVKSINNPMDMQGLTIFIILTIVYNIVVEKRTKKTADKEK